MVYTINMKEVLQTEQFAKWFRKLKDNSAKVAITRRTERLGQGNFGDSKYVGGKVFEFLIDVGKGYRVYFMDRSSRSSFSWSVEMKRHRVMI